MVIPKINSAHGSDTRNIINRAIDLINVQGKSIQDLVAKGQLTPTQYATLIQTVNGLISKGDVSVHDIDINKGKITEGMVAESLLKIIAGNAPIHSVPSDRSITINKIAFNKESSNKYNPETSIKAILEYSNGTTSPHATLKTSDFIRVDGSEKVTFSKSRTIVYYDSNKNFITYDPVLSPKQNHTSDVPEQAAFLRFTYLESDWGVLTQVNLGSNLLTYEPYYNYIPQKYVERQNIINSDIVNKSITADKTDFIEIGKNLANTENYTENFYVDPANGNLLPSTSFDTTDFISIENVNEFVVNTFARFYVYLRADGTHISGGSNIDAGSLFNPPSDAKFIRLSVFSGNVPNIQVEKGNTVTPYQPFGYLIPNLINTSNVSTTTTTDHYGKWNMKNFRDQVSKYENPNFNERIEVAVIGDSWVAGSRRVTEPLRSRLIKDYGDAGIGFVGFSANRRSTARTEVTTTGTWTEVNKVGGLDLRQYASSVVGSTVKVVTFENSSSLEIHHVKQSGSYRYRINGGSWKTVSTSTDTVVKDSAFTQSNVTLEIEVLSGTVTLLNAYMFNNSRGAVVHQLGYSGASTADFIEVNRQHYISELKKSNIKSIGILLGTNDMSQSIGLQIFKENLSELIDRIKTANPLIDVFLISPSGNNLTRPLTMKDYDEALHELSVQENISYVSLYKNMGTYEEQNARGLFEDDVHPNTDGGYQIANVVYDRLMTI